MGGRATSSTDWGCRQNGKPITPKHALNRRNSRKMTPPLNRRKPRCTARFTERRVGALCTQTRRFQAVRASYVSSCRNLVEIRGPRPSQRPWPDLVKTLKVNLLGALARITKYVSRQQGPKGGSGCVGVGALPSRCVAGPQASAAQAASSSRGAALVLKTFPPAPCASSNCTRLQSVFQCSRSSLRTLTKTS